MPPVNLVADFPAASILPIDRPTPVITGCKFGCGSFVVSSIEPRRGPRKLSVRLALQIHGDFRPRGVTTHEQRFGAEAMSSLRLRAAVAVDRRRQLGKLPNCGFDLGQVGVTRRKAEEQTVAAKPTLAKLDPLDRWLAGESIQPKNLTEKQQFANWLRRHPQFTTAVLAFLVAAVVVPVASFNAYRRTALALEQATIECQTVAAERQTCSPLSRKSPTSLKAASCNCSSSSARGTSSNKT